MTLFHKSKLSLGVLAFVLALSLTSCTMNDDDQLFEPSFEASANDQNEDADPDIEEPNGD